MTKQLVCLFLVFVVSSCAPVASSVKDARSQASLSYCSMLNVAVPPPVIGSKAYLGVYLAPKDLDRSFPPCKESRFVEVASIVDGSPADEAGLKEGDVVLSLDGTPVCLNHEHAVSSFRTMIARRQIGSTVTLKVLRSARELSLTAKLAGRPMSHHREALHEKITGCGSGPSAFETALKSQGLFPEYNRIIDGLYERSNMSHNPGVGSGAYEALQLSELTFMMRHPLASEAVAGELSGELTEPPRKGNGRLAEVVSRAAGLIDIRLSASKPPVAITFPELLRVMTGTKEKIDRVLAVLTPEEKILLRETALDPWEDSRWNSIAQITMKVDRKKLLGAFSPLLAFLTRDNLVLLRKDLIKRFGKSKGPVLYEAMTPIGKVIVGGPGRNVYTEDAALILDLGGDDVYLNNAGGTRPGMPLAMVIDWGGNDRYVTKDNFSQGAGLLGGGFLIDLGGDDTFISRDGGQGAGILGLGVLYHGDGNATYDARSYSQGTGRMGIGLILNDGGEDRYICSHHGQGLGLFGGAGILIDKRGNDYYQLGGLIPDFRDPERSYVSMGQGFGKGLRGEKGVIGVPGGIGLLIDEAGNDTYVADYFAQGSSYYYGLGILDDRGGDDQYLAGRYAQGAGIHSSVGVFLDRKGNDHYYASFGVAQGMGHDYGVGFFEDGGGKDWYRGGTLVQGAATNGGFGIFKAGLRGSYSSCAGKCQAYAEEKDGMGIVIDSSPAGGAKKGKINGRPDVHILLSRGPAADAN